MRAWLRHIVGRSRVEFRREAAIADAAGPCQRLVASGPDRHLRGSGRRGRVPPGLRRCVSKRRRPSDTRPSSGTGGFALIAESSLPIVNDISTPDGRAALGVDRRLMPVARSEPHGVPAIAIAPGRRCELFESVSAAPAADCRRDAGIRGGGTLSVRPVPRDNRCRPRESVAAAIHRDLDGIVPAIVDQTSLQYVLHAAVGDVLTLDDDTTRPFRVRVVASLDDSMLQGEILVAERAFVQLFPDAEGYRLVLADIPGADAGTRRRSRAAARRASGAVRPRRRRQRQAPGGLSPRREHLSLDVPGARRHLASCWAVSDSWRSRRATCSNGDVSSRCSARPAFGEPAAGAGDRGNRGVIVSGLLLGIMAAAVAIGPVLAARGTLPSTLPLVALGLVAILASGRAIAATRNVRRLPLVPSLRSE